MESLATSVNSDLSVTLNTAGLDGGEDQPGGAVAQGERPAAEDDPLGSCDRADVLEIKTYGENRQT